MKSRSKAADNSVRSPPVKAVDFFANNFGEKSNRGTDGDGPVWEFCGLSRDPRPSQNLEAEMNREQNLENMEVKPVVALGSPCCLRFDDDGLISDGRQGQMSHRSCGQPGESVHAFTGVRKIKPRPFRFPWTTLRASAKQGRVCLSKKRRDNDDALGQKNQVGPVPRR
jgi:hypothetical protein